MTPEERKNALRKTLAAQAAEIARLTVECGEERLVRESAEYKLGELLEQVVRLSANERQGVAIDMEQQIEIGRLKREQAEDRAAIRDADQLGLLWWREKHINTIARAALKETGPHVCKLCYCNSHGHSPATHPLADCIVPSCECQKA